MLMIFVQASLPGAFHGARVSLTIGKSQSGYPCKVAHQSTSPLLHTIPKYIITTTRCLISSSYRHTLSRHERILYHNHSMIICTPFHERIPLPSIPCDECIPLPCNYVLQVMHMNKLGKQQLSKYIDRSLTQGLELLERAAGPARR